MTQPSENRDAAARRCCSFSNGRQCVNEATEYAAGPGVQGTLYCAGPHNHASAAADVQDGALLGVLKDLLRWLEYGDLDKGIGKQEGVAWTNALAAAIKQLEARR